MPKRDDDLLIADMINCCQKIKEYVIQMDYDSFINDQKTLDAVIRILKSWARHVNIFQPKQDPKIL